MRIDIDENWLMTITSGTLGEPDYRKEEVQIGLGKVPYTLNLDPMYQPGADRRLTLKTPVLPRECWFKVANEWFTGMLHVFGFDSTDLGSYPIGVVEDETGFIHSLPVAEIRLCKPST